MTRKMSNVGKVECICGCGERIEAVTRRGKLRRYAPGHGAHVLGSAPRLEINLLKQHCSCGCGAIIDRLPSRNRSLGLLRFLDGHQNMHGASAAHWKGGRVVLPSGYVLIHVPWHPEATQDGYVREHRLIAERMIGRSLLRSEVVHHKDGNPSNNDPANLYVCKSVAHHNNKHKRVAPERREADAPNPIVECACGCGRTFQLYDHDNRPRRFVHGHNPRINFGGAIRDRTDARHREVIREAYADGRLPQ